MARRENQSLVIALIVMVMLVVILSISTYYFWNASQKQEKQIAASKSAAATAQQSTRTTLDEALKLKQFMGYDGDASITAIEEGYNADMQLFGDSLPPGERNYRKLPGQLIAVIQQRNKQIATLTTSEEQLKTENAKNLESERNNVAVARGGHKKAGDDLAGEKQAFQEKVAEMGKTVSDIQQSKAKAIQQIDAGKREAEKKLALITGDYDKLRAKHSLLEEKIRKLQNVSFERPDGKITYVNQGSQTVYVNLGRADLLQRQATFSVYDVGESDMARLEPKGKIEITKVISDHLSEGRILNDSVTNPILTGDVIYSPAWEAGRPIHFALAGNLDIDRDGRSDSNLVRNLISLNGGVVDAEVDAAGERTGEIGIETRFIVIGKRPTENTDARGLREFSRIRAEAESYGIAEISLERFLTDMGYQAVGKTVKLGKGADPANFRSANPDSAGTGRFRPRQPPKAKSYK